MNNGDVSLEKFFNRTDDLFCVLTREGVFHFVNAATIRYFSGTEDSLVNSPFLKFVQSDSQDDAKEVFKKLKNGTPAYFEHQLYVAEEIYRWVAWSFVPIDNFVYAVGRDITGIKNDQIHLHTAQHRLRLLQQTVANTSSSSWGKIDEVLVIGYQEFDMEFAMISKVLDGDYMVLRTVSSRSSLFSVGEELSARKSFDSLTIQTGHVLGIHDIPHSVYGEHPIFTEYGLSSYIGIPLLFQGNIFGVVSFSGRTPRRTPFKVTDYDFMLSLGQWMSSSIALALAHEQLAFNAAIVSSSDDAIIGQTLDGAISSWNKGAERLLGFSKGEVVGKQYLIIIPEVEQKEISTIQKRLLQGDHVEHYATQYKRKDGSLVEVSLTISPIVSDENEFVGFSSIARDITKEKEIERAKTEFVSLASHQLRTPLSAVNWYAELLLRGKAGKLSEKQRDFVHEIFTGNKRMIQLVNAFLNASRLELGTFIITPEHIDAAEIAQSVLKELALLIQKKNLHVEENFETDTVPLYMDPHLLRIILQDLITNSVKYTPDYGAIRILMKISHDKNEFELEVADTGCGIPKSQQDQIFTKLFRADNAKVLDTEGNGLGLYIVKAVVDRSKGTISFDSEEGKGTTFHVRLPLARGPVMLHQKSVEKATHL